MFGFGIIYNIIQYFINIFKELEPKPQIKIPIQPVKSSKYVKVGNYDNMRRVEIRTYTCHHCSSTETKEFSRGRFDLLPMQHCDHCTGWICYDCQKGFGAGQITQEIVDFGLKKLNQRSIFFWFCSKCVNEYKEQ
jgi:hypothetical protein